MCILIKYSCDGKYISNTNISDTARFRVRKWITRFTFLLLMMMKMMEMLETVPVTHVVMKTTYRTLLNHGLMNSSWSPKWSSAVEVDPLDGALMLVDVNKSMILPANDVVLSKVTSVYTQR